MRPEGRTRVVALSGGIGGAKLALGLASLLAPGDLTLVANTGDDFVHFGLSISPDIDTLAYVLSGLDDPVRGWGRRDESWNFMEALGTLGGATWFAVGDRDLALHVERTRRLAAGEPLSAITADLAARLGTPHRIVPMSDDPVRTRIRSDGGWLDFQDYFVRLRCEPIVREIAYVGAPASQPTATLLDELVDPRLRAVVICPSNPFISIDPILAVPGIREAIAAAAAPVVAVSPIVAGRAIKGPTAKMMDELGLEVSAMSVWDRYRDIVDLYVLDESDGALAQEIGAAAIVAPTLMRSLDDRVALARAVLAAADHGRKRQR